MGADQRPRGEKADIADEFDGFPALSYFGFAFATSLWLLLFASRFFAGVFTANISTAMAYIADDVTEKKTGPNQWGSSEPLLVWGLLGPAIGGSRPSW